MANSAAAPNAGACGKAPRPDTANVDIITARDAQRLAAARADVEPLLVELLAAVRRGDPAEIEPLAERACRAVGALWGAAGLIIDTSS